MLIEERIAWQSFVHDIREMFMRTDYGTRKYFHIEDWAIYDWQNTTWMETDGVNRIYIIFVQSQVHVTVLQNPYRELRRVLLSRTCNGTYEC